MSKGLGVKLHFQSDAWCPICRKLFAKGDEKYSVQNNGKHAGFVHEDCKDLFTKVFGRLMEISHNS